MSGKWQSTAEFIGVQACGHAAGLPARHVHVDTDVQPTASQQKCGQLYADEIGKAVDEAPAMCCPNCGGRALALKEAHLLYARDVSEAGGKSHKEDMPACPVRPGVLMPVLGYSVDPCGCKVSQEWASNHARELQRRLEGLAPGEVMDMSAAQRQVKMRSLENLLTRLYCYQVDVKDVERKKAADYWIVAVVDQMQRTVPWAHNRAAPSPVPLHPDVKDWAGKYGHTAPRETAGGQPLTIRGWPQPAAVDFHAGAPAGLGYDANYPLPKNPANPAFKRQLQCEWQKPASALRVEVNQYGEFIVTLPSGAQQTFKNWHAAKAYAQYLCDHAKNQAEAATRKMMEEVSLKMVEVLQKSEPAARPPKIVPGLRTLPVEDQIKFHGAKEEEKDVYYKALLNIVQTTGYTPTAGPPYPWSAVQKVRSTIQDDGNRGLVYSLLQQYMNGGGDTVSLCQTYNQVCKDLDGHLVGRQLTTLARRFLDVFFVHADVSLPGDQPHVPVLAPKPEPPPEPPPEPAERHLKKRRTIRKVDE